MRQIVLVNILTQRWTIHPYVNWSINGSSQVLVLLSHYTDVTNSFCMSCGVTMDIYRWGGLKMFLKPFPKCWGFTNALIITIHPTKPEPVYHPTFFGDETYALGSHQQVSNGMSSLKVHLNPIFSTDFLKTFYQSLNIWGNYMCPSLLANRCSLALLVITAVTTVVPRTGQVTILEFFPI